MLHFDVRTELFDWGMLEAGAQVYWNRNLVEQAEAEHVEVLLKVRHPWNFFSIYIEH